MKDYYFQGWSCDLEMFCHIFELVIPVKKQKQKSLHALKGPKPQFAS